MQSIEHHFNEDGINHGGDCCYYKNNGKDKLLITIGESWTWGDSLEDHGYNRLDCVWGNKLSTMLDTDWINIARKGASNLWIFYQIEELIRYGKLDYDHIQIVTCCTEWGREYNENWEWHDQKPLLQHPLEQNKRLIDYATESLQKLDTDILLTHNFCDPSFWQHNLPQLDKNWIEITCENLNMGYDFVVPTIAHYDKLRKTEIKLEDLVRLQDKSLRLVDFLTNSKYNYNKASKHPTPESHKFWANYIYDNLQGKQ